MRPRKMYAYLRWFSLLLIIILFQATAKNINVKNNIKTSKNKTNSVNVSPNSNVSANTSNNKAVLNGKQIKVPLQDVAFNEPDLRGIEADYSFKLPIPSRYIVSNIVLHLEIEKSVSLVPQRSSISVFFNNNLAYETPYDPSKNIMTMDINIPTNHLKPYNDVDIKAIQHYCVNCCEFPSSPELWTKINLKDSYFLITYQDKPILPDTLLIRDYVLDQKLLNTVKLDVMTEEKNSFYLSLATKLAGYIGTYIRYRKIHIKYVNNIPTDRDLIVIGSKSYIRNLFGSFFGNNPIPNIGILPNPNNISKAVVFITGDSDSEIKRSLYTFMSINQNLYTGKDYAIKMLNMPSFRNYQGFINIPFGRKVYFKELGYNDFKFAGIYPPPAVIKFRIPDGLFLQNNKHVILHLAYNYGAGARKDSVINIYLNNKYVTSLKMKKRFSVVLNQRDIRIPVYLLRRGINELKIEYAMMAPGGGFCISPNIDALRGTIFSSKSYIEIPDMPIWVKMPYLKYFINDAFPFSMEGSMADTVIIVPSLSNKDISSALTLAAYMGSKVFLPPYKIEFSDKLSKKDKDKNIIFIGDSIPSTLEKNFGLKIADDNIKLDIPLLKEVTSKLFGGKRLKKIANLDYLNHLSDQVFFMMGQSPYNDQKTVLIIYSKNQDYLYNAVKDLFRPKFESEIHGDLSIWDPYQNLFYSSNISKKYYIGKLPWWDYILYKIGFSPVYLIIFSLVVIVALAVVLKRILDVREKRRKEGEI